MTSEGREDLPVQYIRVGVDNGFKDYLTRASYQLIMEKPVTFICDNFK